MLQWYDFIKKKKYSLLLKIVLNTIKFLKFGHPEKFAVIILKVEQRGFTIAKCVPKDVDGIANSVDPDQTAPRGLPYLSENLGTIRYAQFCSDRAWSCKSCKHFSTKVVKFEVDVFDRL